MSKSKLHIEKLQWIDTFIDNVRPYIFVRTEDNILIKRPNQATKINATGAKVLQYLIRGGKIAALLKEAGTDKANEIELFMLAVKGFLEGKLDEFSLNPAVETSQFDLHFSTYPVLSELALTYDCNLKCKFCYAGCNCTSNPVGSGDELTLNGFKTIIKSIFQDGKVPSISFTGGEPTLRPEILISCIEYAKSLGMRVNLITNGTQVNNKLGRKLKKAGLDSAQVSIEGVTSEIHDAIVQSRGAFDKSIQAVRIFKELGLHVHTNTTLNKQNAAECLLMPEFVSQTLDLPRFSMNLIIPTGSSSMNDNLVVSYTEVGKYIRAIKENSKAHNVEFMWYSPIPMCIFNTITNELGNKGCAACDGLLSVAPNGDVLPCASYDEPVGNLISQPFEDIWKGTRAMHFRNKAFAHPQCADCDSFAICNGACPLYWRKMGYGELNFVKQQQIVI
jgi:radical SAM protein with 4Fe4S-binding SPASM domain